MLYPLSYEGLACTFAQDTAQVSRFGLGLAASLPTACAAPVPRAVGQLLTIVPTHAAPIVRLVVLGSESEIAGASQTGSRPGRPVAEGEAGSWPTRRATCATFALSTASMSCRRARTIPRSDSLSAMVRTSRPDRPR